MFAPCLKWILWNTGIVLINLCMIVLSAFPVLSYMFYSGLKPVSAANVLF